MHLPFFRVCLNWPAITAIRVILKKPNNSSMIENNQAKKTRYKPAGVKRTTAFGVQKISERTTPVTASSHGGRRKHPGKKQSREK
jgi:hypothetical protein